VTDRDDRITRALLKDEIEDFLYREADLLDERRYDEWLALLADDVRYWMPMRRNVKVDDREREFTREGRDISWFDEGRETLTRRVRQIQTGIHWAEEPVSRISHLISNVQLVEINPSATEPAEVSVRCRASCPLQAMIGMWRVRGSALKRRVISQPSMMGIARSVMMTSGTRSWACWRPSRPSRAWATT